MAESKTKAFRADQEIIDRIDAWATENGLRNTDILPAIVNIIDLAEQKGKLAGRATEIDNFQSLLNQIATAYASSLQLAQNAEARIREELITRIQSNEEATKSLKAAADIAREEAKAAKEKADAAIARAAELAEQNESLAGQLAAATEKAEKDAESHASILNDKDAIIDGLREKIAAMKQAREDAIEARKDAMKDAARALVAEQKAMAEKARADKAELDAREGILKAKEEAQAKIEQVLARYITGTGKTDAIPKEATKETKETATATTAKKKAAAPKKKATTASKPKEGQDQEQ